MTASAAIRSIARDGLPAADPAARSERPDSVRRAQAGRGVVTLPCHAQVGVAADDFRLRNEPCVVAAGNVEQGRRMPVLVAGSYGRRVTRQAVDPGDQRRGHAGTAHRDPAAPVLVVDRDVPCDSGDVGDSAAGAGPVALPGRLGRVGRAAAAPGASEADVPHLLRRARSAGLGKMATITGSNRVSKSLQATKNAALLFLSGCLDETGGVA